MNQDMNSEEAIMRGFFFNYKFNINDKLRLVVEPNFHAVQLHFKAYYCRSSSSSSRCSNNCYTQLLFEIQINLE